MRLNLLILLVTLSFTAFSQKIPTFDIVNIDANFEKEAMYFYNNNWREFRKEALKQKVITGFEMYKSAIDSTKHFALTLVTTYKDEKAYHQSEEKFSPIMKKVSPNGPKYMNEIKREQFLQYMAGSEGKAVYFEK
jgi:hypothetical protein